MLKKLLSIVIVIFISAVLCTSTFAATKQDILSFVNSQAVCGDTSLFNSYKSTFTRLLKQKKLSSTELDTIYSYLNTAVGILNSKGVCKVSDVSKLTKSERDTVYNSLYAGAGIITSAPNDNALDEVVTKPSGGNQNNSTETETTNKPTTQEGTKVTINTQDNTMDIYENGILVDKVSMSSTKMTYTGPNVMYVIISIICVIVFIATLIPIVILRNKHSGKLRCVKNILTSFMICSITIAVVIIFFGGYIDKIKGIINLVSVTSSTEKIDISLNEDKTIKIYPSYGKNYATLSVPSIGIKSDVYFGDAKELLSLGIGHTTSSHLPTEGDVIIYSGHNKNEVLGNLKNIKLNDEIIIDTNYAICKYKVQRTEILKDTDTDKLTKLDDNETLVLYTCYPFDTYVYTNERFVVFSTLESIEWK